MLYVESRKSFKVRREKKLISLSSVKQIYLANIFLCRVPNIYTRQTYLFAECICLPSVFTNGHSVNVLTDGTQTNDCRRGGSLPSAKLYRVFFAFLPSAIILPSVFLSTRQRSSLPSARYNVLGKQSYTRQTPVFR